MTTVVTAANKAGVDLFNAIGSVASGAGQIVTSLTATASMLDTFVQTELIKQKTRAETSLKTFAEELAAEESDRQIILKKKLDASPEYSQLFVENHKLISNIIARNRT